MGKILSNLNYSKMPIQTPVIAVLGCTGVGKSKLGIELAKRFNGEIISADSMQVYRGLDIITNKVSQDEQKEATHHLINIIDPLKRYAVVDFHNHALPITEKLLKEKKIPMIVGGTNYYIESLLWNVLVDPQVKENELLFDSEVGTNPCKTKLNTLSPSIHDIFSQKITSNSLDTITGEVLREILKKVDPAMANALHPQDRRKIIRSLQVYQQHKQPHSQILANQRNQLGGSSLGGPLRYQNAVMLWIQCEKEVLNKRLDDRVDDMLEKGLMEELLNFHKHYNENRHNDKTSLYTEGIFQSIGFKEFHSYLILSDEERSSEYGLKILANAIVDMKIATKQYARKQIKWIKNRFLRKPDRSVPPVYALDATDLSCWEQNVLTPAIEIVQSVIQGTVPAQKPLPVEEAIDDAPESHYCDVCQRIFVGRRTWEIHLNSKIHAKMKAKLKKLKVDAETQNEKKSAMSA